MREIKFRAWNAVVRHFEVFNLCHSHSIVTTLPIPSMGKWDNLEPFEQFTGLHDKNGKEIYEGDVVMIINWLNGEPWQGHIHPCLVEAIPGGFELKNHWRGESLQSSDLEIIGNIHENPELLNAR